MRVLMDLPKAELEQLNALSKAGHVSRVELIRQAVAAYLERDKAGLEVSYGIWKKKAVNGVAYQDKLRTEWE